MYISSVKNNNEIKDHLNTTIIGHSVKANGNVMNKVKGIFGDLYIDDNYKEEFINLVYVNNIYIDNYKGKIVFDKLIRCDKIIIKNSEITELCIPKIKKMNIIYIDNKCPLRIDFKNLASIYSLTVSSKVKGIDINKLVIANDIIFNSDIRNYEIRNLKQCQKLEIIDDNYNSIKSSLEYVKDVKIISENNNGIFKCPSILNGHFENLNKVEIYNTDIIQNLTMKNVKETKIPQHIIKN